MKRLINLVMLVPLVASIASADTLAIRLQERTVVDGSMPALHLLITNTSTGTQTIRTIPSPSVKVTPVSVTPSDCQLTRTHPLHAALPEETATLQPGETKALPIDISWQNPVGLRPGTYRAAVTYQDSTRRMHTFGEFTSVAPNGADGERYRRFMAVCGPALRVKAGAARAALAFIQQNRGFGLEFPFLEILERRAPADVAEQINKELARSPRHREAANANVERLNGVRSGEDRLAAYQRELEKNLLSGTQDAEEFRVLPGVVTLAVFREYERFLARHPRSFFAPEALHRMTHAIERRKVVTNADPDRTRDELYVRLVREYPNSFRAAEALRKERVQNLRKTTR